MSGRKTEVDLGAPGSTQIRSRRMAALFQCEVAEMRASKSGLLRKPCRTLYTALPSAGVAFLAYLT